MPHHDKKESLPNFEELFPNLFGRSNENCEEESSKEVADLEEHSDKKKSGQLWKFELADPRTVPEYYCRLPPRKIIRNGVVFYEGLNPTKVCRPTRKPVREEEGKRKAAEE
ncbi:unnamed protein product [Rodentolepis nana]|uniref:DNA-binding protein n=1 Tax=Rodentolepis nana TaxID=102285 RepID=A0A0R3TWK0_RODNA|nr:unnamed protein product [Rodentolepis nana]